MKSKNNRRNVARYGVGSLRVSLQRTGLSSLFSGQVEVTPINFNSSGLAFRHSRLLSPGQPVVLELIKDQYRISSVIAIVRYTTQMENHYRCGVEFDFEANQHMRSPHVRDTLKSIEKVLREVVILAAG